MARKFNHAFDVAFEVVSEHENWRDIPTQEVIAGLEKRLAYLKAHPNEVHEACDGYDVFEIKEVKAFGPDYDYGFDDLSEADQRAADESSYQSELFASVSKEDRGEFRTALKKSMDAGKGIPRRHGYYKTLLRIMKEEGSVRYGRRIARTVDQLDNAILKGV